MKKEKTQFQKALEYVKRFKSCSVLDLNEYTGSNYSHGFIRRMIKQGLLTPDAQHVTQTNGNAFYVWYSSNIDWSKVNMKTGEVK